VEVHPHHGHLGEQKQTGLAYQAQVVQCVLRVYAYLLTGAGGTERPIGNHFAQVLPLLASIHPHGLKKGKNSVSPCNVVKL
jgi:hypothetical protein